MRKTRKAYTCHWCGEKRRRSQLRWIDNRPYCRQCHPHMRRKR